MKVIFGIGNPEQWYDGTRHNVGFSVLDILADQFGASFTQTEKFHARIAETTISGEKVLLVKPTTYYNLVGQSARSLLDFYKLNPSDILVVHDDLALPIGTIRTRIGGSDGGNNGIKSLNTHLGPDTARLRIGVWAEQLHATDKTVVVLGKFSREERDTLRSLTSRITTIVRQFIDGTFATTTYR